MQFVVNKYLSEIEDELIKPFKEMVRGDIVLFNAQTGTGKTSFAKTKILELLSEDIEHIAITEPTIVIGTNKCEDDVPFFYSDNRMPEEVPKVYFCTNENLLSQDLSKTIVFVDEAHQYSNAQYRKQSFSPVLDHILKTAYAVVFMSATLEKTVWLQVFPKAKVIDVIAKDRQSHNVYLREVEIMREYADGEKRPTTYEGGSQGAIIDTIDGVNPDKTPIVYVQKTATLKAIAEKYPERKPMLITGGLEGTRTVDNAPEVVDMLKSSFVPDDCRLILCTSVAWEGFDILNEDREFTVIVGLEQNDRYSMLPHNLSQMIARPRVQGAVNLILVKNTYTTWHKPCDDIEEKELVPLIEAKRASLENSPTTSKKEYEIYFDKEGELTKLYMLQLLQTKHNHKILNGKWFDEMEKYSLSVNETDETETKYTELTQAKFLPSIATELIFNATEYFSRELGIYSHKSEFERLFKGTKQTECSTVNAVLAGCKITRVNAHTTFDMADRLNGLIELVGHTKSDYVKSVRRANKIYSFMDNNIDLFKLRKMIWRKWAGKTFDSKEFQSWVKKIFLKHPEFYRYRKRIESNRFFSSGIGSKMFRVGTTTHKGGVKKAVLINEYPVLNHLFDVKIAEKYHKAVREQKLSQCDTYEERQRVMEHSKRNLDKDIFDITSRIFENLDEVA